MHNIQLEGTPRVRNHAVSLLTLILTLTLTFDLWPFNPKTIQLVGCPKIIPYKAFEHFWIIHFLSYAVDKQTDGLERKVYTCYNWTTDFIQKPIVISLCYTITQR